MKLKMQSIQTKIVLWTGLCLLLLGASLITYVSYSLYETATLATQRNVVAVSETEAGRIQTEIEGALDSARTLAQALASVKIEETDLNRDQVNAMLKQVLVSNPQFVGVYTLWEPNAFDGRDTEYVNTEGHDETGRFIPYWVRDETGAPVVEPLLDYEVEGAGDWYLTPKRTQQEALFDPFLYPISGEEVLLISLVVPIVVDGQFQGIAGVDMRADFLQQLADETSGLEAYHGTAELVLISYGGTLAGVTGQPELVGDNMEAYHSDWEEDLKYVQAGEERIEADEGNIASFVPIRIGKTTTPWSVNVNIPSQVFYAEANALIRLMIGIGLTLSIAALVLLWFLAGRIAQPIMMMATWAQRLSEGDTALKSDDLKRLAQISARQDELGLTGLAFSRLINYFAEISQAAERIKTGDLSVQVTPRAETDLLGNTFKQMILNLRHLVGQVRETADSVDAAAEQLTVATDQAGQATSQISATMQQVAQGIQQQTQAVTRTATSVRQVTQAVEGVAQGAQEQAQAVAQTGQGMHDLAQAVRTIAHGAQEQAQLVAGAQTATTGLDTAVTQITRQTQAVAQVIQTHLHTARAGQQTAQEAVSGMDQLGQATDQLAQTIQDLGQRSGQIGTIIETIDDIASQTNLLALNAAIEAARAGEQGKGFAVVADEVRQLAERASQATKEIREMIRAVQSGAEQAVSAMNQAGHDVQQSISRTQAAGSAFETIAGGIGQVAGQVDQTLSAVAAIEQAAQQLRQAIATVNEVTLRNQTLAGQMQTTAQQMMASVEQVSAVVEENTASTEEMAASAGEVNEAIDHIASVSEENSAAVEEVSASTEEMSAQVQEVTASARALQEMAQSLNEIIGQFRLSAKADPAEALAGLGTFKPVDPPASFSPAFESRPQSTRQPAGPVRVNGNGYHRH